MKYLKYEKTKQEICCHSLCFSMQLFPTHWAYHVKKKKRTWRYHVITHSNFSDPNCKATDGYIGIWSCLRYESWRTLSLQREKRRQSCWWHSCSGSLKQGWGSICYFGVVKIALRIPLGICCLWLLCFLWFGGGLLRGAQSGGQTHTTLMVGVSRFLPKPSAATCLIKWSTLWTCDW